MRGGPVHSPRSRDDCNHARSWASGAAPTWRATSFPWRNRTRVGTPRTPNRAWTDGASSTLTLTSLQRPASSLASSSSKGLIVRHGPHHGAQRSTTTGRGLRSATSTKVASSASTTHARGCLHWAQRGEPLAAAGIRLRGAAGGAAHDRRCHHWILPVCPRQPSVAPRRDRGPTTRRSGWRLTEWAARTSRCDGRTDGDRSRSSASAAPSRSVGRSVTTGIVPVSGRRTVSEARPYQRLPRSSSTLRTPEEPGPERPPGASPCPAASPVKRSRRRWSSGPSPCSSV